MRSLKVLFKIRATYIGIGAALCFQLIFFIVWMTAYEGIEHRTNQLSVGIINEDEAFGRVINEHIKRNVPFKIKSYKTIKEAKRDLDEGHVAMIIHIPKTLTDTVQIGEKGSINYWINDSNATMTKSIMENAVSLISQTINREIYTQQKEEIQNIFGEQLSEIYLPEQLANQVEATTILQLQALDDQPIETVVTKVNEVERFSANLVPLMIIISSFVGAMVMVMQHEEAVQTIKTMYSKWDVFFSRQLINFGVAFSLPLITIFLMTVFSISSEVSLVIIYIFQAILYWAFLSISQIFVIMFGNLGMVFNILLLSLQLVTSGVLVPKEVLSYSYNVIASLLPASYGADGYYMIVFGGNSTIIKESIIALVIIICVSLIVSLFTVIVKEQNKIIHPTS